MQRVLMAMVKQLTIFQWCTLAFAAVMIATGLVLSGRGEPIPLPVTAGFILGTGLVLVAAFQSMGVFNQPKEDTGPNQWEITAARKERKLDKKKAQQEERNYQREVGKQAKADAKALVQRERAAAKAVTKAANKAAEAAKLAKEQPVDVPLSKTAKKKKKKKSKAQAQAAAAAAATAASAPAAVEEKATTSAEDDGWVVQQSKLEVRKEKKQLLRAKGADGPEMTSEMSVNQRHYSVIIGAKGSTLTALEKACGVTLEMPSKDSNDDTIVINGTQTGIETVKAAIKELCEKGHCFLLDGDVEKVTMTVEKLGLLIGPGGIYIDAIRAKSNTKINLPSKDKGSKEITLMGEPANIAIAVAAIKQLIAVGYCELTHENYTSVSILFPGSFLRVLIGPNGSRIKQIQLDTETKIKVPAVKGREEADKLFPVTIVGPGAGVEKAKVLITAVQKDLTASEMEFPENMISFLIGEKGRSISALQKSTNTRINVEEHIWDPTVRTVGISGFKKDVNAVIAELNNILATKSRATITFPREQMGALIGSKGKTIQELQDRTKTRISMKDHEWDDTVRDVFIEGLNENVANAVTEIEKLKVRAPRPVRKEVVPPEASETFLFPVARAGVLIGRGGSHIKDMEMSTKTKIKVDDCIDGQNKTVTVEGSTEDVAAAVEQIKALAVKPTPKPREPRGKAAAPVAAQEAVPAEESEDNQ